MSRTPISAAPRSATTAPSQPHPRSVTRGTSRLGPEWRVERRELHGDGDSGNTADTILGQLGLASLRGRLIEYQLRLG